MMRPAHPPAWPGPASKPGASAQAGAATDGGGMTKLVRALGPRCCSTVASYARAASTSSCRARDY